MLKIYLANKGCIFPVWVKIWSPSPVMVTFTYECKILEWDDKPQTKRNKKLFSLKTTLLYFMYVVKWKCRFYSCDWLIVFYALSVVFQPHNDDCDHRIEIIWRGKKNQSIGRSMTTFRRPCGQRLVKHAQKRAQPC